MKFLVMRPVLLLANHTSGVQIVPHLNSHSTGAE